MYLRRIERLRYEPIAELPGFTRGLDFAAGHPPDVGVVAFVGISQVRETAVFSGIPIIERLREDERPAASARST